MAYSIVSDSELSAGVASVSASLLSKLATNNEATANGDNFAPKLRIQAMPAPSAGNAVIREWRCSGFTNTSYALGISFPVIVSGTYRTQILLRNNEESGTFYGRVYRNGAAYGTERSVAAGASNSWTQDLSFTAGDQIQIYTRHTGGGTFSFAQFRIGVSHPMRPIAKQIS